MDRKERKVELSSEFDRRIDRKTIVGLFGGWKWGTSPASPHAPKHALKHALKRVAAGDGG